MIVCSTFESKTSSKKLKQYNSKEKVAIEWTYIVSLKLVF